MTSDSSGSSEPGEEFDHEENQRTGTVGKRLCVTDVSLDGRSPPKMSGFVTLRNQEVVYFLPPHPFYKSHDFISQIVPASLVHLATQ